MMIYFMNLIRTKIMQTKVVEKNENEEANKALNEQIRVYLNEEDFDEFNEPTVDDDMGILHSLDQESYQDFDEAIGMSDP